MKTLQHLDTDRLRLHASDPALARRVAAHMVRNRAAHAQWNPPLADALFTVKGQRERLAEAARAEAAGTQIGWWLCLRDNDAEVIGHLRFSQIARGPFCSAMLGYAIDTVHEGRGLMREALSAALADVFGPRVALHRVQANARPENTRSLRLLDRSS